MNTPLPTYWDNVLLSSIVSITMDNAFLHTIKDGYKLDPFCIRLSNAPDSCPLQIKDGLMYLRDHLIIPHHGNIWETLFLIAHNALSHFGFEMSYGSLKDSYYWPKMWNDLEDAYIPSCIACQQDKSSTKKPVRSWTAAEVFFLFWGKRPEIWHEIWVSYHIVTMSHCSLHPMHTCSSSKSPPYGASNSSQHGQCSYTQTPNSGGNSAVEKHSQWTIQGKRELIDFLSNHRAEAGDGANFKQAVWTQAATHMSTLTLHWPSDKGSMGHDSTGKFNSYALLLTNKMIKKSKFPTFCNERLASIWCNVWSHAK